MLSYSGAFTAEYRAEFKSTWRRSCREDDIPHTDKRTIKGILGELVKI